jgi:hypothetical protein
MFSEPQTVTINAVAKTLPRVSFGDRKGIFEDTLGNRLTVTHTTGRRNRHVVRLDVTKLALDPTLDGVSKEYSMSAQLIIDVPPVGFTADEQSKNAKALVDWAAAAGILLKVTSGES